MESSSQKVLQTPGGLVRADIEFRVVLPGGQSDVQERPHRLLPVAREHIQFSLDARHKLVERQRAVANRNAADVQRHFLALEVQEHRVERPKLLGEFAWGHGGFPSRGRRTRRRTLIPNPESFRGGRWPNRPARHRSGSPGFQTGGGRHRQADLAQVIRCPAARAPDPPARPDPSSSWEAMRRKAILAPPILATQGKGSVGRCLLGHAEHRCAVRSRGKISWTFGPKHFMLLMWLRSPRWRGNMLSWIL